MCPPRFGRRLARPRLLLVILGAAEERPFPRTAEGAAEGATRAGAARASCGPGRAARSRTPHIPCRAASGRLRGRRLVVIVEEGGLEGATEWALELVQAVFGAAQGALEVELPGGWRGCGVGRADLSVVFDHAFAIGALAGHERLGADGRVTVRRKGEWAGGAN